MRERERDVANTKVRREYRVDDGRIAALGFSDGAITINYWYDFWDYYYL